MPRLGVVINSYTRVDQNSGGYVYMINVLNALEGFEIVFYGPDAWRETFLAAVPRARFVAMPDFPWLPLRLNLVLRAFAGVFRRGKLREADVLLTWSHFIADVVPAIASRANRTVVTIHHFIGEPGKRGGNPVSDWIAWLGQEMALVFLRKGAARFVFVSPHVMREAAALVDGRPAFLTNNAVVAPRNFSPVPFDRRSGGIYLGRIHPMKRVEDAIRAWHALPPELRGLPLRIVGPAEGPYVSSLRALVAELNLEASVRFEGAVDDTTKWRLLGEASIFVFPSAEEGWGIAVAEAMTAGLPCVTYDLPVYADLFTAGRVEVPLADVGAMSLACAQLLTDAPRRERLAIEARTMASSFSWEASAAVLRDALTF